MYNISSIIEIQNGIQEIFQKLRSIEQILKEAKLTNDDEKDKVHDAVIENIVRVKKLIEEIEALANAEKLESHFDEELKSIKETIDREFNNHILGKKGIILKAIKSADVKTIAEEIPIITAQSINKIVRMQEKINEIIGMMPDLMQGNAPKPLPHNEITEVEIYGPIRTILSELQEIVFGWAQKHSINGKIWVAGSMLDGVSPVKGLFQGDKFVCYKPFDYGKVSDIDIGIGLDSNTYGNTVPAYIQSKDKVSIDNSFGNKVRSLASLSLGKKEISAMFPEIYAKQYVELIERMEHLMVKDVSLKDRGIHLQFFVLDTSLPESRDLQIYRRKFMLYNNFVQPDVLPNTENMEDTIIKMLMKSVGNADPELVKFLYSITLNNSSQLSYKRLKDEYSKKISGKFNISLKKSNQVLSTLFENLK